MVDPSIKKESCLMFDNQKLSTKIIATLAVVIGGMLIISVISYKGVIKINSSVEEIAEYEAPLLAIVTDLEKNILKEEILVRDLILASKDKSLVNFTEIEKMIEDRKEKTNILIGKCKDQSLKALDHANSDYLKENYKYILDACKLFTKEHKAFERYLKKFEDDIKSNNLKDIQIQQEAIFKELYQMDKQVIALVQRLYKVSKYLGDNAKKDEKSVLFAISIVSVLVIFLTIFISYLLSRNIKSIINEFQSGLLGFFKYLNKQSDEVKALNDKRDDEIGAMAKIINQNINSSKIALEEDRVVIKNVIKVLNEFEQGDLSQRIEVQSSNPSLMELTSLLNKMGDNLQNNIDNVLITLDEYSNNNFLNRVESSHLKEHILKLANGVNNLGDSITKILLENKQNGVLLNSSAYDLLENVDILNKNTNSAAIALEETTAALDQITSNISHNTDNIIKMSDYANILNKASNEGQNLASQTTNSMNEIKEQVGAINDAITVIDQIAFQTNILSLNAAVEAATAGEAGKGFAVVAQEVRNLASRSAEAAKEIKGLVESATDKANRGKTTADNMIEGYSNLNTNISKTIDLISSVENASKEQLSGIEQINDAVSNLDKQTQENASIASQTKTVADTTSEISDKVIQDADKKEFLGKEKISNT